MAVIEESTPIRLVDVAIALEERGRVEDAAYYGIVLPQMISIYYGVDVNELLSMTVDDISELPPPPNKPVNYEDWDNFWFGRAAFANNG